MTRSRPGNWCSRQRPLFDAVVLLEPRRGGAADRRKLRVLRFKVIGVGPGACHGRRLTLPIQCSMVKLEVKLKLRRTVHLTF
jgi:hypothetical protein